MADFLAQQYAKSIEYLQTWKSRYTKEILCDKIILNTFYRQQGMLNVFSKLNEAFIKRGQFSSLNEAYTKIHIEYSKESEKLAAIDFQKVLDNNPDNQQLGMAYSAFKQMALRSKSSGLAGYYEAYEEIATAYISSFIANHQVMLWAALGYMGKSKTEAVEGAMSVGIENIDNLSLPYATMFGIAQQNSAIPYLQTLEWNRFAKDIGIPA